MHRAAVIGIGISTPLGIGVTSTWDGLMALRSGIAPVSRFDASRYPVTFGAEAVVRPEHASLRGPALYRQLVDYVLQEACADLDLQGVPPDRVGVFMGAEAVRPDPVELAARIQGDIAPTLHEVAAHMPSAPGLHVAGAVGARGPVSTYSVACTSSGQAVGEALWAIRRGEIDIAFAGGVDVLVHPLMITGFSRLGALSTRNDDPAGACRPFDQDRDGFVLGDGAGMMILAADSVADRIGPVLGWLLGYGCSSNAWRITDSPPDGRGASAAMRAAVADAGRNLDDVVYINAHGTGTLQNDVSEARGIRRALGDAAEHAVVSSTKSMTGHLVAACGVVESIIALQALRTRVAPPTRNLARPDPDCPIVHVTEPMDIRAGIALSNAFGFGGSNACLAVGVP